MQNMQAVGPKEPKERSPNSKAGRAGPWYQQFVGIDRMGAEFVGNKHIGLQTVHFTYQIGSD